MTITSDSFAALRAIVEKHGWVLCASARGKYLVKREGRSIIWDRAGYGHCDVEWLGVRLGYHTFLPSLYDRRPNAPREEFAEAILSAYSDEKFVAAAHARLEASVANHRAQLTAAEERLEAFEQALIAQGLQIPGVKEDSDD